MSAYATTPDDQNDRFGSGLAGAIVLHVVIFAGIIGWAFYQHANADRWGENASSVGSIEASMVSAIPLPSKVPPVKDNVLTPDDASPAPTPPPKEAAAPPPKDTDVLIKAKTPEKPITKTAPTPTEAPPKHPQPTPVTPKATTGEAASQFPQSVVQVPNGTATITVQDRTFGNRYAYYVSIVGATVNRNWYRQEIDPGSSQGKSVSIVFDIQRDGSPANVRLLTRSGSASLDTSALRALQRVDGFGPLPSGDHITVEYTFDYRQP